MILRLILFFLLAWVVAKLVRILIYAVTRTPGNLRSRGKYGVGTVKDTSASVEFKDVQDAEFEDIKDNVQK